jgi:HlyD family secretion protein
MARQRRSKKRMIWLTFLMGAALGGYGAYRLLTIEADVPRYLMSPVERGDIISQVAASGTVAAVTTVQVGTQVSGTIAELYADYNSEVKRGQLLARLDPALLEAQVQQQEANVYAAEANLNSDTASIAGSKANQEKAKVDARDKERVLNRTRQLFAENLVSRDDLETAQAALSASLATLSAAEAQI